MIDTPVQTLENKRFLIDKPSTEAMHKVISACNELSQTVPEVCGVGFFGSTTNLQNSPKSDLDAILFYDGARFDRNEPYFIHGNPPKKTYKQNFNYEKYSKIRDDNQRFEENLSNKSSEILNTVLNIAPDQDHKMLVINISEKETLYQLNNFGKELANYQQTDEAKRNITTLLTAAAPLYLRFALCIGKKVYENRQFILDTLEKSENGELQFQSIMEILHYSERTFAKEKHPNLPDYNHYPKSISEARKYFQLK